MEKNSRRNPEKLASRFDFEIVGVLREIRVLGGGIDL
jgi:hypothetical protein